MKDFVNGLKGIAVLYKPLRWRIALSVFLGLLSISASLVFVWLSKVLVDIATGVRDSDIYLYVWLMIGVILFRILITLTSSYWLNLTMIKARNDMRYNTFAHVLASSWNGREAYHSADVLNRIQEDIRVMIDLVCVRIPDIVITGCQLVAASIFLISLAPGLLGVLVALMVVGIVGSKMFYKTQRVITKRIRELDSKSQQHIQENLLNRALVLTLVGVEKVLARFTVIQDDMAKESVKRLNYGSLARGFMSLGYMAGYTAAFLWGIFGIRSGDVTYGMMTAFLQLVSQVQAPISQLSSHIPAFIQALTSEERLSELTILPEITLTKGKTLQSAPAIEFKGIDFCYPGDSQIIFKDFNHRFPAGGLTVIMGPTGRGKSTLIRMVMGLLKPQRGEIVFECGGKPEGAAAMNNFMYVPQGNSLFSGTVLDNLLMGKADAGEDEIRRALHIAAADFIYDLPDALQTRCGESGNGLSEGQAQRIAIARALLHEGTILILDEATSALDVETENTFLERLTKEFRGRKTVLFISHRDRVNAYADEILTL